jgi:hypothetical protein
MAQAAVDVFETGWVRRTDVGGDACGDAASSVPWQRVHEELVRLAKKHAGLDFEVINAGVSGDTSAGGLRRLDWSMQGDVRVLLVALGGNDALRGLAPTELKANLSAIIDKAEVAQSILKLIYGTLIE